MHVQCVAMNMYSTMSWTVDACTNIAYSPILLIPNYPYSFTPKSVSNQLTQMILLPQRASNPDLYYSLLYYCQLEMYPSIENPTLQSNLGTPIQTIHVTSTFHMSGKIKSSLRFYIHASPISSEDRAACDTNYMDLTVDLFHFTSAAKQGDSQKELSTSASTVATEGIKSL